jgi:glycosyltransferase involved in cell wall biosynthesis
MKKISVIIPCYNEFENLISTFQRIKNSVIIFTDSFEFIFVDDGSSDKSFELLNDLSKENNFIKIIKFSRNFGHQNAIFAGLENAEGDAIFLIDADLQDPPEVFVEMYQKWQLGYQVVYGIRKSREGNFIKKILYKIYHKIFYYLSELNMSDDLIDFCLIDKNIKNILISFKENNLYFRGLRTWIGFKQTGVEYFRKDRNISKSKYSFFKLYNLAIDGILNFSLKPLTIIFFLGFCIFFISLSLIIFFMIQKFTNFTFMGVHPQEAKGFFALVTIILFFGGLNLMALGVIGEYIGRSYKELKARPRFIIEKKINFTSSK